MRYINHSLKSNDLDLSVVTEISKGSIGIKPTIDYIEIVDSCPRHGSFLYGSEGLRDNDYDIIIANIKEKNYSINIK